MSYPKKPARRLSDEPYENSQCYICGLHNIAFVYNNYDYYIDWLILARPRLQAELRAPKETPLG